VAREAGDGPFSGNDFAVFRSTAEQSGFALGNALLFREADEKRRFETEIRNAGEVQRVLLPQGEPEVPGFRISGTNVPARLISGDYYDYLDLGGGRHGMVIADVSGKGVAAGLMMAMCRSVLRCHSEIHGEALNLIAALNRQLFPDIREDMFISLFYAQLIENDGRIELVRAGHDPALWFHAQGTTIERLKPPGLALGVDDGTVFERVTRSHEIRMESGDILLLHTDGVKEATNRRGEEFGMERLERSFREHAGMGAESVVVGVQQDLDAFCDGAPQIDDVTLLAIERR
jgi:sigma-B regulation protein RsbU (phosphoserine phosphatase)